MALPELKHDATVGEAVALALVIADGDVRLGGRVGLPAASVAHAVEDGTGGQSHGVG